MNLCKLLEHGMPRYTGQHILSIIPCLYFLHNVMLQYTIYRHTHQRKAIIATLPFLRVQLMNHRQSPARARDKETNTLRQPMQYNIQTHKSTQGNHRHMLQYTIVYQNRSWQCEARRCMAEGRYRRSKSTSRLRYGE
jgi:hypothetical protein